MIWLSNAPWKERWLSGGSVLHFLRIICKPQAVTFQNRLDRVPSLLWWPLNAHHTKALQNQPNTQLQGCTWPQYLLPTGFSVLFPDHAAYVHPFFLTVWKVTLLCEAFPTQPKPNRVSSMCASTHGCIPFFIISPPKLNILPGQGVCLIQWSRYPEVCVCEVVSQEWWLNYLIMNF